VDEIITIELLGESFRFRAEEGTVDPKQIAMQLMETLKEVETRFPEHSRKTNKLAILMLAALNITKRYVELQENHTCFMQMVSTRANQLDRIIGNGVHSV